MTAEAVALAMAMPEAVASDELSVEQNQTKGLAAPRPSSGQVAKRRMAKASGMLSSWRSAHD